MLYPILNIRSTPKTGTSAGARRSQGVVSAWNADYGAPVTVPRTYTYADYCR